MLKISNLTFAYHDREIFSQANLVLSDFARVAIIGDNGAGKTTLLQLLNRTLLSEQGNIKLDGNIGYLPQTSDRTDQKSGGERTKLALERLFTQNYDVLLLDEPTNNLDFTARDWLVQKLLQFRGLTLIVSHDRYFIDQVAEQLVEIKDQKLQLYSGNFSDYQARNLQLQSEQRQNYEKAQRVKHALNQQISSAHNKNNRVSSMHFNKLRDENKMAFHGRRNHAQNTASKIINSAKSKIVQLDHIEKTYERKTYQAKISTDFLRHRRLLKVTALSKSYSEKKLFADLNFEVFTSERIRVAGGNGTGKTTLFEIILGNLAPDTGDVRLAPNLRLGYIAQDVFGLNLNQNFFTQTEAELTEVFQAAATMDLTKHDLQKPCQQLSRGQLTKLAFLKAILSPVDLLILDEPTNHLDIRARENIEQALKDYPGTILFATHDEKFANIIQPNKIIELS